MGEIRGTIDDAISRIVTFCTMHPYIWRARSEIIVDIDLEQTIPDKDERNRIAKDLEQAQKDMQYVSRRFKMEKLSEKQMQALRDAGVIYEKDEADELAEQYSYALKNENPKLTEADIRTKTNRFRSTLRIKLAQFNGLDNYRQAFIDALATGDNEKIFQVLMGDSVKIFDLSQNDLIAKHGYTKLLHAIGIVHMREDQSFVTDSQFIMDSSLKYAHGESSNKERTQSIIIKRYGLDNNGEQTSESVAEKLGISKTRVKQIEDKTISKMRRGKSKLYMEASLLKGEAREEFIRKYFEHHDIFTFSDSNGLTEDVKADLRRIYEEGTRDAIEDVDYIEQAVEDIKSNKVPCYVFDDDTYLSDIEILSNKSLVKLWAMNISTVGELMQETSLDSNKEIKHVRELLKGISFKTDAKSVSLSDEVFDVLNFPGNVDKVLAKHVQPIVEREGIPFSVADFIMMSDDEISEMSGGTKKLNQIRLIRDKLRGHFRDLDVDKIEESSHEKLVQIILMKQQTIADQEEEIDALMKQQDTQTRD